MQTKKTIQLLSFMLFLGIFGSCEKDGDELINPNSSIDSPEPLSIEMIENGSLLDKAAVMETGEWEDVAAIQTINFRIKGNKIIEQKISGQNTYDLQSVGTNFIYGYDNTQKLNVALPIWAGSNDATLYYRPQGSSWTPSPSTRVIYSVPTYGDKKSFSSGSIITEDWFFTGKNGTQYTYIGNVKFGNFLEVAANVDAPSAEWVVSKYENDLAQGDPKVIKFITGPQDGANIDVACDQQVPAGWVFETEIKAPDPTDPNDPAYDPSYNPSNPNNPPLPTYCIRIYIFNSNTI